MRVQKVTPPAVPDHRIRIIRGYSLAYPGYVHEKSGWPLLPDVRADGPILSVYDCGWRSQVGFPTTATAWYGLGRDETSVAQASLDWDRGRPAYGSFIDPVRPGYAGLATEAVIVANSLLMCVLCVGHADSMRVETRGWPVWIGSTFHEGSHAFPQ